MTTIKLSGGDLGMDWMLVRCNLAQASAPVEVAYRAERGEKFESTQYQCADTRHTYCGLVDLGKRIAAAAVEMPADEFDCDAERYTRKITISGNWRKGGPDNEWAGTGTVDADGAIECSADLGDEACDAITEQIAAGDTSGSVTVHSAEQDRDITYEWEISD